MIGPATLESEPHETSSLSRTPSPCVSWRVFDECAVVSDDALMPFLTNVLTSARNDASGDTKCPTPNGTLPSGILGGFAQPGFDVILSTRPLAAAAMALGTSPGARLLTCLTAPGGTLFAVQSINSEHRHPATRQEADAVIAEIRADWPELGAGAWRIGGGVRRGADHELCRPGGGDAS